MSGVNQDQLLRFVINPVLEVLGKNSAAARVLLLGTALVESGCGRYIKQFPRGPALGIYQMEAETHDDIYENWLNHRPDYLHLVLKFRSPSATFSAAHEMMGNLYYATAIARINYLRIRERLPDADDAEGMARYWKAYWNTEWGAGRAQRAVVHFEHAALVNRSADLGLLSER